MNIQLGTIYIVLVLIVKTNLGQVLAPAELAKCLRIG